MTDPKFHPQRSFEIVVKTFEGLEDLLAKEIMELTGKQGKVLHRAVAFTGGMPELYRANYFLNTAVRVLKTLFTCPAGSNEELYAQINRYPWEKIMKTSQTLRVEAVGTSRVFQHSRYAAQLVKDAIVDRFRQQTRERPSVDLENPDIRLQIMFMGKVGVVSLDSSGDSLHMRGYRPEQAEAPLNEVLASALVLLSGWDRKTPFVDPMCGSGTILLEATRIALGIAPGFRKRTFGFHRWADYDPGLWNQVLEEGARREKQEAPYIIGGDISEKAISITARNAERAGLRKYIRLANKPFAELSRPPSPGTLLMNPPYGTRLPLEDQARFYAGLGDVLKKRYAGFQAWIFSANRDALKSVGLKSSARYTLKNGPLESYLYGYNLYTGTMKEGRRESAGPGEGDLPQT